MRCCQDPISKSIEHPLELFLTTCGFLWFNRKIVYSVKADRIAPMRYPDLGIRALQCWFAG